MRTLIVFAAGIALFGGMVAALRLFDTGTPVGVAGGVAALAATVGGLCGLSRLDDRLKQKADSDWVAHANERFKVLVALAHAHDFELKVKGASQMSFALIAVAMGSAAFLPGIDWMLRILAAVIFIPGAVLLLLQAVPQLGRPVITLTRASFRTPTSPDIPWHLVYGVHYSETKLSPNDSESRPYGTLIFSIPTLAQETSRFSPIGRLMHGLLGKQSRSRITVTLRKTSEPPGAIARLAEHLWKQSTGRVNDWNPYASDAVNAAFRELKAADEAFRKQMDSGDPDPLGFEKHLALIERNNKILLEDGCHKTRHGYWAVAILVLLVVVYVVGRSLWHF